MADELDGLYRAALSQRVERLTPPHEGALRLFNGYTEGRPGLAVDVYGTTLVIHDASGPKGDRAMVDAILATSREVLPWLECALWKIREAQSPEVRNGAVIFGTEKDLTRRVREDGVLHAVRLTLNRDASLYLDTQPLRAWAKASLSGARVLNTFAYTGSLGVAAKAGGAQHVVHTDMNNAFLTVAKDSYALNSWEVVRRDFMAGDFFDVVGRLKRDDLLFDCVFVDPPFFSVTEKGRVDLEADMARILNKVRPLIADGGWLVAINNGVFASGAEFHKTLEGICAGGYLSIHSLVPAPLDFAGHPSTRRGALPVDPAPFNHSTKMAILSVKRKDGRRE